MGRLKAPVEGKARTRVFDGGYILRQRKLHGWTLRFMAERSGLSNPYLSQLETGRNRNPGINAIVALADCFGYGVGQMLDTALVTPTELRRSLRDTRGAK